MISVRTMIGVELVGVVALMISANFRSSVNNILMHDSAFSKCSNTVLEVNEHKWCEGQPMRYKC